MPLYTYTCSECEIELEERRSAESPDWPPIECPVCHGLCERTISLFSVHSHNNRADAYVSELNRKHALASRMAAAHGPNCSCCRPKR